MFRNVHRQQTLAAAGYQCKHLGALRWPVCDPQAIAMFRDLLEGLAAQLYHGDGVQMPSLSAMERAGTIQKIPCSLLLMQASLPPLQQ